MKNSSFILFFLVIFMSCIDDTVAPKEEINIYPYALQFEGHAISLNIYEGDTVVYFNGPDILIVTVVEDSIDVKGRSFSYQYANYGNPDSVSYSRYISAAGGTFSSGYQIKEEEIWVHQVLGNSFKSKYNFTGKKI